MVPIRERILTAFSGTTRMPYHDLMAQVFPINEYPNAYQCSTNGGPPGCAMALGAALRRLGGWSTGQGCNRYAYAGPRTGEKE